jgi:Ca2+-binding EF-hand superfamily protein
VGKKPKKPKPPPDEGQVLHKAMDKWSRTPKTERGKLHQAIEKYFPPEEGVTPRREGSEAEYNDWFDRLAGGREVWREEDIKKKPLRELFARVADGLGVTGGEIRREEFVRYARRYLSPGNSPLWDPALARGPVQEGGKLFRKLDRNKDGVLDEEEMPAELRGSVRLWDGNGDGVISEQEYQAYFEERLRRVARERGTPLPDGGVAEVVRGPAEGGTGWQVYRPGQLPAGLPGWFSGLDGDRDGQVGLYEWKSAGRDVEEFLRLDRNRDGFLTAEELLRATQSKGMRR